MSLSHNVAAYPRSTVFPVDAVPIGASQYVIDGAVAAHRHMFVEIAVVLGGSGQHIAQCGAYSAQIGDVFVIHPGTWHAYERCQRCVIANCYFGAELLDGELAWMRQDSSVAPLLRVPPDTQAANCHAAARLSTNGCKQYLEHPRPTCVQSTGSSASAAGRMFGAAHQRARHPGTGAHAGISD